MEPINKNAPFWSWRKEFGDFSFKLKAPENDYSLLLKKSLNEDPKMSVLSNFSEISDKLWSQLEHLPSISSLGLSFENTQFNIKQYQFLSDLIKKMAYLKNNSIHLVTFIQNEYMTLWRDFYYATFLQEVLERPVDLSFITRFKEYEKTIPATNNLNNLLQIIQKNFSELKEFAFVNGNLEDFVQYPLHLQNATNILKTFGKSLEKLLLFFRTYYLKEEQYLPIFDEIDKMSEFDKLQSIRIAFGGAMEPTPKGIRQAIAKLDATFEKDKFTSLRDFGIFFANLHLDKQTTMNIIRFVSKILPKLESMVCLLQTDFENSKEEDMNEILEVLFMTKSQKLREFTLGFCADHGKINKQTMFGLERFRNLLKENLWTLLKFNLYYEIKETVGKKEVKDFLIILTKYQEFLVDFNVKLMNCGVEMIGFYGFDKILENYRNEKKRSIIRSMAVKNIRKSYRKEIVNEILEKFF